jgi:hypothetical protein
MSSRHQMPLFLQALRQTVALLEIAIVDAQPPATPT